MDKKLWKLIFRTNDSHQKLWPIYLVKEFPPLILIGLLDGDSGWWVPDALSRRQIGVHVFLGARLDDLHPLGDRGWGWPRTSTGGRARKGRPHFFVRSHRIATHGRALVRKVCWECSSLFPLTWQQLLSYLFHQLLQRLLHSSTGWRLSDNFSEYFIFSHKLLALSSPPEQNCASIYFCWGLKWKCLNRISSFFKSNFRS